MSIQAVKLVQYTEGLTLAEYVVLISLASLAGKNDWRCWPSLTSLAGISNIEKKTAIRAIQRLTAPYNLPDPRPLVSLVENRKVKIRNHTYELNVPLFRELQEKRRKRVAATTSTACKGVLTTPTAVGIKTDFEGPVGALTIPDIAFPGGPGARQECNVAATSPEQNRTETEAGQKHDQPAAPTPAQAARETAKKAKALYLEMRTTPKEPATPRAPELVIGKLAKFEVEGHNSTEILKQSVTSGRTDLYPPKPTGTAQHPTAGNHEGDHGLRPGRTLEGDWQLTASTAGEARPEAHREGAGGVYSGAARPAATGDSPSLFPRRNVQQVLSRPRYTLRLPKTAWKREWPES